MQMLSSRRIKLILAVAILVPSVALVTVVVLRQLRSSPPGPVSKTTSPDIDMAMTGLRFSEMRDDLKLWDLVSERADYDKEPGTVRLTGVHLETFEGKAGGVVITSKAGNYHEVRRLVQMYGSVHAVTRRGMVFDSDSLEYFPATGMLQTDREVTVVDGRLRLKARGMEASLKDEKVRFLKQVDAVIEGKHAKR
ncbi:MAG: LPS export ABC transporter periplasmic protein LptC [Trichlorobacter sp.]